MRIKNQFGHRNLSAYDRSLLALKPKPFIAAKAKEKQIESGGALPQKSTKPPVETRQEIAKAAGISHDTIAKVEKIEQSATPEIKAALKTGELSINAAYKDIKRKEKEEKAQERLERKQYELTAEMPADTYKLFQADIQDGLAEGVACCATDIDFLLVETAGVEPKALIEYKHEFAPPQTLDSYQYIVLQKLASPAQIPLFAVKYTNDFSSFYVVPANEIARNYLAKRQTMTEYEYVKFLYKLRGRKMPEELSKNLGCT